MTIALIGFAILIYFICCAMFYVPPINVEYYNIHINNPYNETNNGFPIFGNIYKYNDQIISVSTTGNIYSSYINKSEVSYPHIFTFNNTFHLISQTKIDIPDKHFSVFNMDSHIPAGIAKINNNLCIISDNQQSSLIYLDCSTGKIFKRYFSTLSRFSLKHNLTYPSYNILPDQPYQQNSAGLGPLTYNNLTNKLYYIYSSEPTILTNLNFVELSLDKNHNIFDIKTYSYNITLDDFIKFKSDPIKSSDKSNKPIYRTNGSKPVKTKPTEPEPTKSKPTELKSTKPKPTETAAEKLIHQDSTPIITIPSLTTYNNSIYSMEIYNSTLIIYKLDMINVADPIYKSNTGQITKSIFYTCVNNFSNNFSNNFNTMTFDDKYLYLGIDTKFLQFEFNLIKIKYPKNR